MTAAAMFRNVKRFLKMAKRESAMERFERHLSESSGLVNMVQDIAIADDGTQEQLISDLREYVHYPLRFASNFPAVISQFEKTRINLLLSL